MIPLIRVRGCLLVVVQGQPGDDELTALQERVAEAIFEDCPLSVIIDVRALEIVDSFIGHLLGQTAALCKVLGSGCRIVGVRPDLAMTWVELGLTIASIQTRRTLDEALDEFTDR